MLNFHVFILQVVAGTDETTTVKEESDDKDVAVESTCELSQNNLGGGSDSNSQVVEISQWFETYHWWSLWGCRSLQSVWLQTDGRWGQKHRSRDVDKWFLYKAGSPYESLAAAMRRSNQNDFYIKLDLHMNL